MIIKFTALNGWKISIDTDHVFLATDGKEFNVCQTHSISGSSWAVSKEEFYSIEEYIFMNKNRYYEREPETKHTASCHHDCEMDKSVSCSWNGVDREGENCLVSGSLCPDCYEAYKKEGRLISEEETPTNS